ncbi:lipase secretion chaperone [Cupriavidus metallidurans]|uniref:Lipase helper protein n=1 Tax=Cupriavidus metallidurans (strain ATCC 43123 / DSM 2839 / NBRC 102507 / CH34) TaxID=266264 RepID=Q1LGR1_CUPMC|nr:lipase secretion chaperone [Cupriavidus metallidurans]ABF10665.1 lipase chaperone [Cupriavidus metallidurans CH34]QGS31867.1 lipase secretion chaperone [Cupriavidus metallidurans]
MISSERRPGVTLVLVVAGLVGAAVYWATAPTEPAQGPLPARSRTDARPELSASPTDSMRARNITEMPSLAGVDIPPGPEADAQGNLRLTRALRTYFDYFLSASHDAGDAAALDQLVRDDIRKHVPQPAEDQAWRLWQRYRAYLSEMQPKATDGPMTSVIGAPDTSQVQRLRALIADRNAARARHLPDVAAIWFDDEQTYDDAMLARLEIATQPGLDDAERQRRLSTLDATLPESVRAAREAEARPQAISKTIASMQTAGRSPQDIGASLAQAYGPEVAQRYQQQAQAEQAWKQRYDDYAAQRSQIVSFAGLSEQDRAQQLETLRRQTFTNPSEALQAEVMDKAVGGRRAAQ